MIREKVVAEKISSLVLQCGRELDESVALVKESCSDEEFSTYRKAIGKIMGELLIEVMNPLYKLHPEIKPPDLYIPEDK